MVFWNSIADSMSGWVTDADTTTSSLAALLPLFREIGHLKRIRSARSDASIAQRLFLSAWSALMLGEPASGVMRRVCSAALAAVRLGDLDRQCLLDLGLSERELLGVLRRAFRESAAVLDRALADALEEALGEGVPPAMEPPAFSRRLAAQPRAGVTCPGKPRIILQPAENHAEHCLIVGIYAVLLAPAWQADPVAAFLAGLAHHLHNAAMPDSGFTGETLLGQALGPVMDRAREAALNEMPRILREQTRSALAPIGRDETPEAQAFHAADVLDRVLEVEQHLVHASLTMEEVLGAYALVHEGPVKPFHDRVLLAAGLA